MESLVTRRRIVPAAPKGFTLVEMLVVLAIIVVMTAVAVVGQGSFNRSILLTETAYTVALSVREAQSLGLSSRTFQSSANHNTGYGVHFANGTTNSYSLFADIYPSAGNTLANQLSGGICAGHTTALPSPDARPGNCTYDSAQDGLIQTFRFDRGFTVGSVCGHAASGGASQCLGTNFDSIDITFLRPNTQTIVIGTHSGVPTLLTDACIHLSAPDGANTDGNVYVSQVGEVAVVAACP